MLADDYGSNGPDALACVANVSRMFTAPDTPKHRRKVRLHLDLDPQPHGNANGENDEPKPNRSPGSNGMLQRSDAVAYTSSSSSYEDGEVSERDRELEHEYEFELQSDHTRRDPNLLANPQRPSRTETQLKAKVTMYEMEVQELRNMLKDATDRFSRQLIAERHKQQAQAAQLDLKFQDEFEQFEQHHRHELVQVQRDYDTRLARLNRELEAVRTPKPTTCTAEAQTAMDGAEVDVRWRAQLDALNEEKLALQRVLSSVLRGFVRVKQALLPAAADSDLETCLARLSAAEDSCNAVIDEWTDELVAAIGACDANGEVARPDSFWEVSLNRSNSIGPRLDASVSSVDSADHEPHDADRLSRSVAELRTAKRELEFRYESRELEFAKQLAGRDSMLAERDTQIDAAQRQIRSLRTFVDELLVDREAEHDEHVRRVAQLESALTRRTGRRVAVDELDDLELQSDARSDPANRKRVADELDDEESLSDSEPQDADANVSESAAATRKRSRRDAHAPLNSTMNEKQRPHKNADGDGEDDTIFPFEFDEVDAGNKPSAPPSPKAPKDNQKGLFDELLGERNEEIAILTRRIEQLNEEVASLKMDNETVFASERRDAITQTDKITTSSFAKAERPRLASDTDSNAECDDELVARHNHAAIARAFAAAPSNSLAHELANELGSDLLGDDPAADVVTLRTENDSLRLSVEALRAQLTDRSDDLLAANSQLETLEAELEKMMQYNSSLTHDFDDVQSMLERQQTELERTQDEADERLKEAVRAVTDRYESLLAGLKLGTHARPAGPAISETFNELEEEFYVLKERVRELTAQVDTLHQQTDVQRTEKETLDRLSADLQAKNLTLQQTIGRLEEEKASLQTCATQAQAENTTLLEQLRVRNKVSFVALGVQTDNEPAPPSIVSDTRVPVCTTHSAMQTTPPSVSCNTTATQTDAQVQAFSTANVALNNSPAKQSVATQKDDETTLDNMQRCEEQIRRLLTDWNNWQSAHSNAQRGQSDADAANAKELKRRLDTEFERAAQLDAEMRSFLSWRVVTIDEERPDRTASQQYASTNSKQRDDLVGSELLPLLRSKLQLADIDLLRILESVDYRLRQERLTSAELRESLDAERVRAIEIMSDLARERSHSMDLKLELQTARTKVDDIASRLEAESLKRKQLESLLEKQRNENSLLQEHVANGLLQTDAGAGKPLALDRTRAERALRADLDTERQKRTLLEIELERSNSDLRTKRREFEELLRKQQTLERAKDDEIARLRNELQLAVVQKEAQVDELSHKLAETERQLTDANVQLRNHEALLREFKSRVEVQHEYALQLESTVQQLRSRLQSTLRSHNDEKASLLAQLEREKAASRRVHTQTTVFEQLTQASARLSLTDRNGEAVELFVDDLYKRLQRAEAHRRSLAYQKRYLSVLLNSFEQTEHATLAELARVTDALDDPSRATNSPLSFKRSNSVARAELANGRTKYKFTRPFFRFRSGARVVIAAQRLNRMSKRWENVHCPVSLRALTNGGSATPRDTNLLSAQSQLTSRRSSLAPLANGFDSLRSPAPADTRPRCSISNLSLTPAQSSLMTFR